ncbi:MAG TPA: hypothetical protein VFG63_07435 [Nocardioidaceae bacterium]|nr:hypothetical protein [Nocardioidaceae bacterium]
MASKNPLGRLADAAVKSLKDPVGTAGKVVEQAKGSAALGKMVAEQVGKSAVSMAAETAGAVVGRASGRKPASPDEDQDASSPLRSVPDVNEPGHTPAENRPSEPDKKQGDPLAQTNKPAKKAPGRKAPAKKAPAKTAAAKKTAATPNDVAEVVEAAVAEDPGSTAATPAKKAAKKASATKSSPGDKLPTKKAAAKQAPAKKTAEQAPTKKAAAKKTAKKAPPRTAEQVANIEGTDVATPAGTPGAGKGHNPDTAEQDLDQPGTEPIVEDSTAKAIAKETQTMRKAAEKNPE